MASEKRYRYPGIDFFKKEDWDIFCGRANDADKLFTRILNNNTMVLHGESGTGKSSLVQAGILHLLDQRNKDLAAQHKPQYLPVTIRLDLISKPSGGNKIADDEILIRKILFEIYEQNGYKPKELPYIFPKPDNLWYTAKSFENNNYTFLLIFDQFEELQGFNYKEIKTFAHKLSELFVSTMPPLIYKEYDEKTAELLNEKELTDEARTEFNENIKFLEKPLSVRILFIVREDKLGTMSLLSDYFPDILKNDFLLLPLNEDNARRAISEPSGKDGNFLSDPFKIEKSAEDGLINNLADNETGLYYDPIQLQIVCSNIEKKIAIKKKVITVEDIPPVGNIIRDFYSDTWIDIKNKYMLEDDVFMKLRKEMIDVLVINGKRNLTHEDLLIKTPLHGEILSDLVEVGLLRRIRAGRDTFYQLCHDRFIEPIQVDKININAQEEVTQRLEQERQELIRKQEEEKQEAELEKKELIRKQEIEKLIAEQEQKQLQLQIKDKETENIKKRQRDFKRYVVLLILLMTVGVQVFWWQSHQREINAKRDRIIAIMTALQRTGNPTLSYVIGRDWYEQNNNSEKVNSLLLAYDSTDGVYLSGIVPLFNDIDSANFSDDGKELKITDNYLGTYTYTWNIHASRITSFENLTLRGTSKKIQHPSGETFYLSNFRDSVEVYDSKLDTRWRSKSDRDLRFEGASFSEDGHYLLIEDQLFNFSDGKKVGSIPIAKPQEEGKPVIPKISIFLNDSRHIAVAYSNDTIKVFELEGTGHNTKINPYPTKKFTPWFNDDPVNINNRNFTALATDKKGHYLFAATPAHNIEVFRLDSAIVLGKYGQNINNDYPNQVASLTGHNGLINCMSVSTGDSLLLSGSTDNTAILWNLNSFRSIARLAPGKGTVSHVAFSRDNKNLLTGTDDLFIYTWKRGKASELYDKNALYRFSPFEYVVWNLDEKKDGKLKDTTSFSGLYSATINYIMNVQSNKAYGDGSFVPANKLKLAKAEIKNMFWRLIEKKKFKDSISAPNMRLILRLFNNLLIPKMKFSYWNPSTSVINESQENIKYYKDEGWKVLLIDASMFREFEDLAREIDLTTSYFLDSVREFDKAYSNLIFFRDTILNRYMKKFYDSESRGMSHLPFLPKEIDQWLFRYYLYLGDTANAGKIAAEIINEKDRYTKIAYSRYDGIAYQVIIYLVARQYDAAKNLYLKNKQEINETRIMIDGDFFELLNKLKENTNATEEIDKFMKEFKIIKPPL